MLAKSSQESIFSSYPAAEKDVRVFLSPSLSLSVLLSRPLALHFRSLPPLCMFFFFVDCCPSVPLSCHLLQKSHSVNKFEEVQHCSFPLSLPLSLSVAHLLNYFAHAVRL